VEVGIVLRFMVQRGCAWTRSLLGLCAHEIHICGEASAIDLVKELMLDTGDEVKVSIIMR
jgi:ATP-dependent RNA helicase SUPV3L1/SUV3